MALDKQHDTLIVVPVFNEEESIEKVIDSILADYKEADILVVNDGSLDQTEGISRAKGVFIISHIFNLGLGASFQTACQFAVKKNYDYLVRLDGDGQHNPIFIGSIVAPIIAKEADIVIGSRFLAHSGFKTSFPRLVGIFILALILTLISKKKITDPTSGFCAMNRRAFKFFAQRGIDDYPEPEILIYHKSFRIKEVPIVIDKRRGGVSSITLFRSVYYMIKVLLSLFVSIFRKEEVR